MRITILKFFIWGGRSSDKRSVYLKNNQSVKFWHLFYFYPCCRNKNGRQNRHKIEKWPFWTKFKAFGDRLFKNKISAHCFEILIWYLLVLYINFSVKCLKFAPKWTLSYFQPILAAIFVTIATVKVRSISDFYTWAIVLIN